MRSVKVMESLRGGLRAVEIHREFRRALSGLAFPAGPGNSGLPISLLRIESAGDASGFLDVGPTGLRAGVRGDLARRRNRHITLRAGGPLLDRAYLTGS